MKSLLLFNFFLLLILSCNEKDTYMVAWWNFDKIENGLVKDLSGNRLHAIVNNAHFIDGKIGKAFHGDGTGYLEVKHKPLLDDFKDGITITVWIYREKDSGSDYNCIITREIRDTWSEYFDIAILKNKPLFAVDVDGAHYMQTNYPEELPLQQWIHLAGTFNNKKFRLYIDGKEAASGKMEMSYRFSDQNPLIIGSNTNDQGREMHDHFLGRIDDLRVYNRALSAEEIADIYRQMR